MCAWIFSESFHPFLYSFIVRNSTPPSWSACNDLLLFALPCLILFLALFSSLLFSSLFSSSVWSLSCLWSEACLKLASSLSQACLVLHCLVLTGRYLFLLSLPLRRNPTTHFVHLLISWILPCLALTCLCLAIGFSCHNPNPNHVPCLCFA